MTPELGFTAPGNRIQGGGATIGLMGSLHASKPSSLIDGLSGIIECHCTGELRAVVEDCRAVARGAPTGTLNIWKELYIYIRYCLKYI